MNSVKLINNDKLTQIPIPSTTNISSISISTFKSNSDLLNNLLKSMLVLNLVLLDKFNKRSNLSLILIDLKSYLDNLIDNYSNIDININLIINKFLNSMNLVFKNSIFFKIQNLNLIYENYFQNLSSVSSISSLINLDFNLIINKILCCSESLSDFKYFNGIFNELDIINHDFEKLKNYYLINSFNKKILNNDNNLIIHDQFNNENLLIVQSKTFMDFHLKRWKSLNLLDRHIFKNN
ncbi:hypothetical protein C6P40_002262 [Pichia californica]|uniref:Uncharacterized protein n=1 Tax=Pichia californica TaxID=460514 RepID=A0A9P7BCZ6_9ASCO|nr:hypothetical protein C6P40_002262 [[Candida] californica]